MGDLTYQYYSGPRRPFKKGDPVTVTDREGRTLSHVTVKSVRGTTVVTDCGREWTTRGWYKGDDRAWPFPTIRPKRARNVANTSTD